MIKAILFDFDGTIVNSDPATLMAFESMMRHYQYPAPTNEQLLALRGLPVIIMIKKLLPNISEEKVAEMYEFYINNTSRFMPKIKLFPHVIKILNELKSQYKLAIITSRRRIGLNMLLKFHHLDDLFPATVAKEDVQNHKPHPEGIEKVLQQLDIRKEDSIYVGDAENDVKTAHNAGIPCVIISPTLENYGAEYTIKNILELPLLINRIYPASSAAGLPIRK